MKSFTEMAIDRYVPCLCIASSSILAYWIGKKLCAKKITDRENKFIVITGCDSGIGLDLAQRMLMEGFIVVGTVTDMDSCGAVLLSTKGALVRTLKYPRYENIYILTKLIEDLRADGKKLHCLVNNAGVMVYGMGHWYTTRMVERQIETNLIGTILMTKALTEELKLDSGRVVNISSTMGILAAPLLSVYCATKAGIEAYSNSLRREGLRVIIVRPCNLPLQTHIMKNSRDDLRSMKNALNDDEFNETIGPEIDVVIGTLDKMFENDPGTPSIEITDHHLIKCLKNAILLRNPNNSYTAANWFTRQFMHFCQLVPTSFLDTLFRWNIPYAVLNKSSKFD